MLLNAVSFADAHKMFDEFKQDIHRVKKDLAAKKITVNEASMLLSAIQARQNQVLIYQNQKQIELLKELTHKMTNRH